MILKDPLVVIALQVHRRDSLNNEINRVKQMTAKCFMNIKKIYFHSKNKAKKV